MSRVTKCDWCAKERNIGSQPMWFVLSYLLPPGVNLLGIDRERDACSPHCVKGLATQVWVDVEVEVEERRKGD